MRTFTLSEKLSLNFISLCLLAVSVVGFYSYHSAKSALVNRTYQQLTSLRIEKQSQIEQYFHERVSDFNLACQIFHKTNNLSAQNSDLDDILQSFFQKEKSVSAFAVFSISGKNSVNVLFKTGHSGILFNNLDTKFKLIEKCVSSDSNDSTRIIDYMTFDGSQYIALLKPLLVGANTYAVMLLSPESINKIMLEDNFNRGLGYTGEAYLVGSDSLMRSQSRFIKNSFLKTVVTTKPSLQALKGSSGTIITPDYRNTMVMSSYGQVEVPGLKWVILAEIDQAEAMKQIVLLRNDILLMGLSISLLILGTVLLLSHRITHPLVQLKSAIGKVGEGNFDLNLPVESEDEIGRLTQSFNTMAQKLSEQQTNLKEREARLKYFYDATQEGIILHNQDVPLEVNHSFKAMSGYSAAEIKQLKVSSLIDKIADKPSDSSSSQLPCEANLVMKDGGCLPVEIQSRTISMAGFPVEVTVVRDLSERKKAEESQKKERARQLRYVIDGQEQERQRLSRELHDGIGQQLIAAKLMLELYDPTEEHKEELVEGVKVEINRLIDDVRRISNNLTPSVLSELDLGTALQNLCKGLNQGQPGRVVHHVANIPDKLNKRQKNYIFRIVQEALTNAIKHSDATLIELTASVENDILNVHITDNGKGFDPTHICHPGNGIINIRERAELLGGHFYLHSLPGKGADIYVNIPILPAKE
ncbi:MAG TPA: HAMP domain-containing protein [Williamwhitmania sp.]|nr:HAMP domain-containing protein [Williamwhitmania sp.]